VFRGQLSDVPIEDIIKAAGNDFSAHTQLQP
jgi:hypothetical protein